MNKIDITKPVQTRDGRKVTDLHWLSEPLADGEALMGVVTDRKGYRAHCTWYADGRYVRAKQCKADLINVPEEAVLWANAYPNDVGIASDGLTIRNGSALKDRIGYFKYTFIEGQSPKAEFVPLGEDE